MRANGKRRLEAICPDGSIVHRCTHRNYSHVVVEFEDGEWGALGWASSLDLAEKNANRYRLRNFEVAVVPCVDWDI